MGRVVEVLVGVSALAGIATFLGVRSAIRRTLRTWGRKPDYTTRREQIKPVPNVEEPVEGAPPERRTP